MGDQDNSATLPNVSKNSKNSKNSPQPRIGNRAENEKMNLQLYQKVLAKQRIQNNDDENIDKPVNSDNNTLNKNNNNNPPNTKPRRTRISPTFTYLTTSETASQTTTSPNWELLMLVDNREIKQKVNKTIFHKMCGKGINCEKRNLALGDFMWVVRKMGASNEIIEEVVCDVLVERKRLQDLAKSFEDGRFEKYLLISYKKI